jgi:hypothetical protein
MKIFKTVGKMELERGNIWLPVFFLWKMIIKKHQSTELMKIYFFKKESIWG